MPARRKLGACSPRICPRTSGSINDPREFVLSVALLASLAVRVEPAAAADSIEGKYLANVRQVTSGFVKAGEGYFSPDGKTIIYQAVPQDYPFYQIYKQPLAGGAPQRISTGRGRTTCSYFSPDGKRSDLRLEPSRSAAVARPKSRSASSRPRTPSQRHAPPLPVGFRSVHGHLRGRSGRQEPAAADRRDGLRRRRGLFARRQADRLLQRPRRRSRPVRDERRRHRTCGN